MGTPILWDFALESGADLEGSLGGRGVHKEAKAFMKKAGTFREAS